MGTDIHSKCFKKNTDGKYIEIDVGEKYGELGCLGRNYLLFSVLADVRNGTGFAGCKTYNPVEPIAYPRGLPKWALPDIGEDITSKDMIDYEDAEYAYGDHSYTYLSSDEILEYFETQRTTTMTGIIAREDYIGWDGGEYNGSYSGFIAGPDVRINDEIHTGDKKALSDIYTHVRIAWDICVSDYLSYFTDMVKEMVDVHGPFTMVIGFDS